MTKVLASLLSVLLLVGPLPVRAGDAGGPGIVAKGLRKSTLTPRDADPLYAPMRYALVVGVNRPADSSMAPLRFAEHDADSLAAALRAPEVGGFDKVVSLPRASRAELLEALQEAERLLRPQDLFLFYFSGHGTTWYDASLKSSLFLMGRDAQLGNLQATGLSVRDLQGRLERMRPRRKVMIIDACYNGDGKSALGAQAKAQKQRMKGNGDSDLQEPLRESEAHLFAAAIGQPALEDQALGGGVYTHFLIQALKGDPTADTNRDGAISVAEAHSFARDRTMSRTGFRQVPWANYRIVGREDIYLAGRQRAGAERALVYTFNERYGGARVYLNGQEKGVLPSSIELEPGTYDLAVKAPDGTELFSHTVALAPDNSLRIDDIDAALLQAQRQRRTIRWAGAGVTAALGVSAAATGLQTLTLKTYYDTGTFQSPAEAEAVRTRGEQYRLATNLLLGSAILTGVTTAMLSWRAPKLVLRKFELAATVAPSIGPDGGQVSLAGEF